MKKYLLLLFGIAVYLPVWAQQQYLLTGRITTGENAPVPFASVYIRNSTYGTSANEKGFYEFKLQPGNYTLVYRFVGYKEHVEQITIADHDARLNVQMEDEAYQISQFAKNNKAVVDSGIDIIQNVLNKREYFQTQVKDYSCVVYIKGVQKLVSAPKSLMNENVAAALSVDSTGKGILYQNESLSDYSFQLPNHVREVNIATRTAGQNTAFSYNKASDLSVDLLKNIVTIPGLASHNFISPLGGYALHYYRYKMIGSKVENGIVVHKIQVLPRHAHDPVFTGFLYITQGDWRIYAADLMLTNADNGLNFVDTLRITQQQIPIRDSVWMPLSVHYQFRGKVLGFQFEGYYLGIYNNYKLDTVFPRGYFTGEVLLVDSFASRRDTSYWNLARPVPLTGQEHADYIKKDFRAEMQRSIEKYTRENTRNNFYVIPYFVFGYKASYKNDRDSLITLPFIQTLFYNTVEGVGINLQATYKHYTDVLHSYTITPNIRYGFADKLFNANVSATYNYDPLQRGKLLFSAGSNLLDLNNVGTRSLYFNTLSTLLSGRNYVKYYRSEFTDFGYQHDITRGILLEADLSYANRTQLYNNSLYSFKSSKTWHLTSNNPLMPDAPPDDKSLLFLQNQALAITAKLTFTIGQQYITSPTGRTYVPPIYPQIMFTYRKGINGILGSDVNYDFASVELLHQHLQVGLIGYTAFKIVAGDFFNRNKLYFMDYYHFAGNQGTTFDPTAGSFHFLPFYTFSAGGAFMEAHVEHNFSGYFFNSIPLLRKLKLDEIIGANYLTENTNRNYSEFYIGVQRLIFRVDYGISLTGSKRYLQGFRIFYGIK